jgi:L-aspartate oxidase
LNGEGVRFMPSRHRMAELAPRDVVAREIFREQQSTGDVWLDATSLGTEFPIRFPGIFALCRARGIDPRTAPIPVTPAAHYMMGGVVADLAGRASVADLFVCGEVARTGVHGANRLASNSLLEGLVFAERVARELARVPKQVAPRRAGSWNVPLLDDRGAAQVAADRIRLIMWEHAGIVRNREGLEYCLQELNDMHDRLPAGATEERNLTESAQMIAHAALERRESRGGHYRSDFPRAKSGWAHKHIDF